MRMRLLATIAVVLISPWWLRTAHASKFVWTGATSTDWSERTNWNPLGVPGASDTASIGTNAIVTVSSSFTVANLNMAAGSTLTGSGSVNIDNSMSADDVTLDGSGTLSVGAKAQARFSRLRTGSKLKRKLNNSGKVAITGGDIYINSDILNNGNAVFDMQSDGAITHNGTTVPVFRNSGTFLKSAGTGITALKVYFQNSGRISVKSGTLDVGSGFSQSAGSTSLDGGTLASNSSIVIAGGTLEGTGTINGNVVNYAKVRPGHSPGSITINGNYTMSPASTLDMEIGGLMSGTQYDQLIVRGTATLSGTLNILQWSNFLPGDGNNFQLINYYSLAGNFNTTNLYWSGRQRYFTTIPTSTYYVATSHSDTGKPLLTVGAPQANAGYTSFTAAVGTVSDTQSGLQTPLKVVLYRCATATTPAGYWAGGTSWTSTYSSANDRAASGSPGWAATLPPLSTGQYYIRASANDKVGNATSTSNIPFWVDSIKPSSVTFTTPGSPYATSLNTVSGTATDNPGGIGLQRVVLLVRRISDSYYWNGLDWSASVTQLSTNLSGSTWSRSAGMPTGLTGAYYLTAIAYDKCGNNLAAGLSCTIDITPPAVTVTAPLNATTYTTSGSVTGTACDNAQLATVKVWLYRYGNAITSPGYWAGGSSWTTDYSAAFNEVSATGTTSWSLVLPVLAYGQYGLHATAWDKANNSTRSLNIIFWKSTGTLNSAVSSGSASVANSTIVLTFATSVDAWMASDVSHYSVTVNGVRITTLQASYNAAARTVTLTLPTGSLHSQDGLIAGWTRLFDTSGRILTGQYNLLVP